MEIRKISKIILMFIAIIFLLVLSIALFMRNNNEKKLPTAAIINNTKINLETAVSLADISKGLGGRDRLESGKGLLFIFPESDYHIFWMKDMNFPIDIIWINNDVVADVTKNVPNEPNVPLEKLKLYQPREKADKVLEVNAGFADKNNIKTGDRIKFIKD